MDRFGELLRFYRQQSIDSELHKKLTQERLGELLGKELGDAGFSGAAVSDWERDKSQIHKDHRSVLISLIKVFYACGGLGSLNEANTFLLSGNYRPLDQDEQGRIFQDKREFPRSPVQIGGYWQMVKLFLIDLIRRSTEDLEILLSKRAGYPPKHWPEFLLALLGWPFRKWSSAQVFRGVVWILIWFLTWRLTFPLLDWPYESSEQAWQVTWMYIGGVLALPLIIAAFTRSADDEFWQQQQLSNSVGLRLYTHQGAFIGFTLGYLHFCFGVDRILSWNQLLSLVILEAGGDMADPARLCGGPAGAL